MATRTNFGDVYVLARRAHDVGAGIRGEEKPSDRLAREQSEAAKRFDEIQMARARSGGSSGGYGPTTVIVEPASSNDGFLTGVLVSNMMNNGTHVSVGGSSRLRDDEPIRVQHQTRDVQADADEVDVGGRSSGGDSSFTIGTATDTSSTSSDGPDSSFH